MKKTWVAAFAFLAVWTVCLTIITYVEIPTMHKLEWFIHEDRTDEMEYVIGTRDCRTFSRVLQNNSRRVPWNFKMELFVIVTEKVSQGHMLCAVHMFGVGWVYIEPQNDIIMVGEASLRAHYEPLWGNITDMGVLEVKGG